MRPQTVEALNSLNQEFYNQIAPIWNPTIDYYWEGWNRLLESILELNLTGLKVLDIGCGNARFFEFLQEKLPTVRVFYTGVDSSDFLTAQAISRKINDFNKFDLIKTDILQNDWLLNLNSDFNLVVMFGLIHHIPGQSNRLNLFNKISNLLQPGGKLIFTTYQFLDLPRLQKRVLDFKIKENTQLAKSFGIDLKDLEKGDYILDWVKLKTSYRYCHYFNPDEITELVGSLNLNLEKEFLADDRQSNRNRYFILDKKV